MQLNVVSPHPILPLSLYILFKVVFTTDYELHEELFFTLNVVHAELTDKIEVHLVPIVNLVRNRPEHAVTIALDVSDLHAFVSKEAPECVFLFLDLLDSFNDYPLFLLAHVSNLLFKLVS